MKKMLALLLFASPALAAPKIEVVSIKPNPAAFSGGKPPEVEMSISVTRTAIGSCDARVDFGDGEGRTIDFGMAAIRTLKHTYRKGGNFKVVAKGAGKTPCEGMREVALTVTGGPAPKAEPKKAEAKKTERKAEKKKAEKKKADPKSAPKEEPPK
jgi:hypothetical protein